METKKRIIICGYPKSGNTWLTRLTADVVGCPVTGFWGEPKNEEIAIEGESRISDFECYKAHHSYDKLLDSFKEFGNGTEKVLYIIRDPRDVIVSALHYFSKPHTHPLLFRLMKFLRLSEYYHSRFRLTKKRVDLMTDYLLKGTRELPWMNIPWGEHLEGYNQPGVLFIRYEDLLKKPLNEMKKVLNFLDLDRVEASILKSIDNQSFEKKKRAFILRDDRRRSTFMRRGRSGEWNHYLDTDQNEKIVAHLKNVLIRLGYES